MERWGSEIIIDVEDVIKPEKIDEYKKHHAIIWKHLTDITQQIIIMRRLADFPYHLFVAKNNRVFWRLTNKSFFDSVVIAFTALFDKSSELSLFRFKNKVLDPKHYRLEELDEEIERILRERTKGLEKKLEQPIQKIKQVRNHHIAHLDWKKVNEPEDIVPYQLPITTFQQALDVSSKLFHVFGFNVYYGLRSWDYNQTLDTRNELDIDRIFRLVVSQSFWFSDIEETRFYDNEYEKLSSKDKKIVDDWRKKLGK